MGCFRLWLGSESGSQQVLDAMKRRTNVERVREMTKLLQKYGIQVGMFIMLGYEGETQKDLELTLEHLKLASPDVFVTTVSYPIKGTEYFGMVDERVVSDRPWRERTDRDLLVAGRPSPKYYRHANRWLVNAVTLHQQLNNGKRDYKKLAGAFVNSQMGRLGMAFNQKQKTTFLEKIGID